MTAEEGRGGTRAPSSTYRIQLRDGVDFAAVAAQLDDLVALGVSHVYLSPLLEARPGSSHAYDVVDPRAVAAELGGEEGLRALADAARDRGLGLIADLVPNHLGTGLANLWWTNLLTEGRSGSGAAVFDVDWRPVLPGAGEVVVLPVLGAPYGEVLQAGELEVVQEDGELRLAYHEHRFPLDAWASESVARSGDLDRLRGTPGDPESWTLLHHVLEHQHYRLVHWRIGDETVNYRRFFAVDELAAVRVEDDEVFDLVHATTLRLLGEGVLDGLRIDHVDGLADPGSYAARLATAAEDAVGGPAWIVLEKILAPGEALPGWPVAGATGYDFLGDVLRLFVDPDVEERFTRLARERDAWPVDLHAALRAAKAEVLTGYLAAETDRLARRLHAACAEDPSARDVTCRQCHLALVALIARLPVYRTYAPPGEPTSGFHDWVLRAALDQGAADVDVPGHLWARLRALLADGVVAGPAAERFVISFAQVASAAMAKGVEDTALYRQHRLLALNEVGVEPVPFGADVAAFHAANATRAAAHPAGMLTTSTHDTKRGEDVRLRIAALTELGPAWEEAVTRWDAAHATLLPQADVRYLAYQTLVGVWPPGGARDDLRAVRDRVAGYLVKALREGGERTTWAAPDQAFEEAVGAFVASLVDDGSAWLADLEALGERVNAIAMISSLAQVLLRTTSPGVPDTYQGADGWTDDLVDPDNRRPVDLTARQARLARAAAEAPAALLAHPADGAVKTFVLRQALHARRHLPGAFGAEGAYVPLSISGAWADHVVAFARTFEEEAAVVVAPRLPGRVMAGRLRPPTGSDWADTAVTLPAELADTAWTDLLGGPGAPAGRILHLADVLEPLPVALLFSDQTAM